MDIVVIVKEPVSVVGIPENMYWMLRVLLVLRDAFKSIFKFGIGSRVARIWKSSLRLVVAGVTMLSAVLSQPLDMAFWI